MDPSNFKGDAAELHRLCYPANNPQDELKNALRSRNREQFQLALKLGADPDLLNDDCGEGRLSVFELCCQRSGHAAFIEDCLRSGCKVNKINEFLRAAPINLAAESEDADNIRTLLANATVQIDQKREGQTPLSQLCSGISDVNFDARFAAIRLLVEHQANVNIADDRGQPPILVLLKSRKLNSARKRIAVQLLLDRGVVDVDTHWEGQARKLLQRDYVDLILPAEPTDENRNCTDAALLDALRSRNEKNFVRGCDARMMASSEGLSDFVRAACTSATDGTNPMQIAIDNGLARAVEKLLRCGAEVRLSESEFDAIRRACTFGHHRIVGLLLSAAPVGAALITTASNALAATVPYIGSAVPTRFAHTVDHQKCFDLLLTVPGIDIDRPDTLGNTALHAAVQYKERAAVRSLLRRGASMGVRNAFGAVAIADIDADLLADHLDECLSETQEQRNGGTEYELCVRFTNLVSPQWSSRRGAQMHGLATAAAHYSNNEMTPIAHIVRSRELQHLAKHPVIASFLFLKWYRLAPAFYVNFACFALYCVSLLAYILCRNGYIGHAMRSLLSVLVIAGMVYMVLRELFKLALAPVYFVRNASTYLALALIVLPGALLVDDWTDGEMQEQTRRTISAIAILLAVGEFFVLLGSLPVMSFSTHLVMLLTVTRSFMKSLLLYSILLIAFALCFCMLLGRDTKRSDSVANVAIEQSKFEAIHKENTAGGDDDAADDDQFNKFVSPGLAIVKTVVMLTGEFDAGSIDFENNGLSYFVFVIFVFLVSTVLFNLLNGLAVNDTQAIKADAELTNLIYRAKLLTEYELILGQGKGGCLSILFKGLMSRRINLFPDFLPQAAIKVLPIDNNRVLIPSVTAAVTAADKEAHIENPLYQELNNLQHFSGHWQHLACCFGLGRCTSMEPRIVKNMRAVLQQRKCVNAEAEAAQERHATTERRLTHIEGTVSMILVRLDKVMERMSEDNSNNHAKEHV